MSEEEIKAIRGSNRNFNKNLFDKLSNMTNKELKEVFKNASWSFSGQLFRYCEERINSLQQENQQLKEILNEIKNIDIFKEFTFPLMKRWEEQQVLSSIDYQFKNTFIRKINELESGDSNE